MGAGMCVSAKSAPSDNDIALIVLERGNPARLDRDKSVPSVLYSEEE